MSSYIDEFQGRFIGIMQWDDCDALLQKLINQPDGWYLYDTLVSAPNQIIDASVFTENVNRIKKILTDEHRY